MEDITDPLKYLEDLKPVDWANIPKPLMSAILCIKKCLLQNSSRLDDITQKFFQSSSITTLKIEQIESKSNNLNNLVYQIDENSKNRINDKSESLYEEIAAFKKLLTKDLNFKQKSLDTKLISMQEQLLVMKNTLNSFSLLKDIDKSIKEACENLRKKMRKDVIENIVAPEIVSVNKKIESVNQNNETYISKFSELFEVIRNSIKVLGDQSNERYLNFEKILAGIETDKEAESKNFSNFSKTAEKSIKGLESQLAETGKNNIYTNEKLEKYAKNIESDIKNIEDKIAVLNEFKETTVKELAAKIISQKTHSARKTVKPKKEIKEEDVKNSPQAIEILDNPVQEPEALKPISNPEIIKPIPNPETIEKTLKESEVISTPVKEDVKKPLTPIKSSLSIKYTEDYQTNLDHSGNLLKKHQKTKKKLLKFEESLKEIQNALLSMQSSLKSNENDLNSLTKEFKDKLSWFPMNISQLKNKPPNEARLYTLEARLRAEENARVEHFNKLVSIINELRLESTINYSNNTSTLPQINGGRQTAKILDRKLSLDTSAIEEYTQRATDYPKFTPPETIQDRNKPTTRKHSTDGDRGGKTNNYFLSFSKN
jgi:hypothetical protein